MTRPPDRLHPELFAALDRLAQRGETPASTTEVINEARRHGSFIVYPVGRAVLITARLEGQIGGDVDTEAWQPKTEGV